MVESRHLEHAAQRLQQRAVRLRRCAIGLDVLLGGVLIAFLATLVVTLGGWAMPLGLVYGGLGVLALVVFTCLSWRVRTPALGALVQADQALRGQERLSTAYEYLQRASTNPFVPALVGEAEDFAPRVEPRLVFPLQLPRRVWAIPVLLAAIVGLVAFEVQPLRFDDLADSATDPALAQEGKRLEQWGQELEALARQERLDRSMILARHMQHLGQRLQREKREAAHVAQRIATLSDYLQRLQQELRERALMSDVGAMSVREVLESGKSLKQELQELLQLLQNETLPREMTAVAEQSIMRLRQQIGQRPELETLLQNLRAGDLEAARQLLRDVIQQQQATEEIEHLDRARRALEYSSRSIQRRGAGDGSAEGRARGDSQGTPAEDIPSEMGSDMPMDDMLGMEDFAASGAEAGSSPSYRPPSSSMPELRESEQPVSEVDVKSSGGPMRLGYMRYLPMQNEAKVPMEQAVIQYQQAAEEVLTRETLPRTYREQIKQYFLSLGMMR